MRVFLDFETNKKFEFYMVGCAVGNGSVRQAVLDPDLAGLGGRFNLPVLQPADVATGVLSFAKKQKAVVVAYSEAEKNIFSTLNERDGCLEDFSEIPYLNLAKAAKLWIRKHHKKSFEALGPYLHSRKAKGPWRRQLDNSLPSRMRLLNYPAPVTHAIGKTTARFNAVKAGLVRHGQAFEMLTPVQKAKAAKVTKHNQWDVQALPILFDAIAEEDISIIEKATSKCLH